MENTHVEKEINLIGIKEYKLQISNADFISHPDQVRKVTTPGMQEKVVAEVVGYVDLF